MIERAFELARTSSCRTVDDIRRKLKTERYDGVDAHVSGSLSKQLKTELGLRLSAEKPIAP